MPGKYSKNKYAKILSTQYFVKMWLGFLVSIYIFVFPKYYLLSMYYFFNEKSQWQDIPYFLRYRHATIWSGAGCKESFKMSLVARLLEQREG